MNSCDDFPNLTGEAASVLEHPKVELTQRFLSKMMKFGTPHIAGT